MHIMRKLNLLNISVPVTVGVIAGCAALAPAWLLDLDHSKSINHAYAATDQQSVYLYSQHAGSDATIDQYDLDGNIVSSMTIPALERSAGVRLVELSGDDFFITDPDPQLVTYANPVAGEYWQGIENNLTDPGQTFSISNVFATSSDELAFSGYATNPGDDSSIRIIGVIDQQGNLKALTEYPDMWTFNLKQSRQAGPLVATGRFTNDYEAATGNVSYIIQYDDQLNEINRTELDFEMAHSHLVGEYLLSVQYIDQQPYFRAWDLDGNVLKDEIPLMSADDRRAFSGQNSFYLVGTKKKQYESAYTQVITCNYDYDFNQRWCKDDSLKGNEIDISKVTVNENDDLVMTLQAERIGTVGATGFVAPISNTNIIEELEFIGEERSSVKHLIISPEGNNKLVANEQPYYHRGAFVMCGYLEICVERTDVQAGVCEHYDSVVLNDNQVFSVNDYCSGESGTVTFNQLSFWEK